MVVDPNHGYLNKANWDICGYFELKKTLFISMVYFHGL